MLGKILITICVAISFGQSILGQTFTGLQKEDYDDWIGEVDSFILKSKIKESRCVECFVRMGQADSCGFISKKVYNEQGELKMKVEGENIAAKKFFCVSRYRLTKDKIIASKTFYPDALYDEYGRYRYLHKWNADGSSGGLRFRQNVTGKIELKVEYTKNEDGAIIKKLYDEKMNSLDSLGFQPETFTVQRAIEDSIIQPFSKTYIYKNSVTGERDVWNVVNNKGNLTESVVKWGDSYVKHLYIYDKADRLIRNSVLTSDNNFAAEKIYTYNEAGNLIKYFDDGSDIKVTILYDDYGRQLESKVFYSFSKTTNIDRNIFDNDTRLLKRSERFSNNNLISYRKYEYLKF